MIANLVSNTFFFKTKLTHKALKTSDRTVQVNMSVLTSHKYHWHLQQIYSTLVREQFTIIQKYFQLSSSKNSRLISTRRLQSTHAQLYSPNYKYGA